MMENKIATNPVFARLDEVLKKFNIFDALGVRGHEIRHSRFLGFLLNPNESHGLGTKFLVEFLRQCSQKEEIEIPLLDLNVVLTSITIEKKFNKQNDANPKHSLDLLIEIPFIATEGKKWYVIAIENKINSKQSKDQLKKYSEHLGNYCNDSHDLKKIYLTLWGEDANEDNWVSATYDELVYPAIESILRNSEDTLSDYLIQILKDYKDAIDINSETSHVVDDLVVGLSKDISNAIQSDGDANLKRIISLYPRAYAHIKQYDADPRVLILNNFRNSKPEDGLLVESSDRNYLHLSVLSEENRKNLAEICSKPTKYWLKSNVHLALELVLVLEDDGKISGRTKLVLGPTNIGYPYRQELFEALHDSSNAKSVSDYWSVVKLKDKRDRATFKSLKPSDAIAWVDSSFQKQAASIKKDINDRISAFFSKFPNPSIIPTSRF